MKLQTLGFISSEADTSLFIFNQSGVTIYMLIYIDDIIIAISCLAATEKLIKKLTEDFAIKDLCDLSYFLDVEVTHENSGLLLSYRGNMQRICY